MLSDTTLKVGTCVGHSWIPNIERSAWPPLGTDLCVDWMTDYSYTFVLSIAEGTLWKAKFQRHLKNKSEVTESKSLILCIWSKHLFWSIVYPKLLKFDKQKFLKTLHFVFFCWDALSLVVVELEIISHYVVRTVIDSVWGSRKRFRSCLMVASKWPEGFRKEMSSELNCEGWVGFMEIKSEEGQRAYKAKHRSVCHCRLCWM